MGDTGIALYVLGVLFTVYVVAATWQSKDADSHVPQNHHSPRSRNQTVDRRVVH